MDRRQKYPQMERRWEAGKKRQPKSNNNYPLGAADTPSLGTLHLGGGGGGFCCVFAVGMNAQNPWGPPVPFPWKKKVVWEQEGGLLLIKHVAGVCLRGGEDTCAAATSPPAPRRRSHPLAAGGHSCGEPAQAPSRRCLPLLPQIPALGPCKKADHPIAPIPLAAHLCPWLFVMGCSSPSSGWKWKFEGCI